MLELPPAFAALAEWPQFIPYKIVPKPDRPGKSDKIPLDHRTACAFDKGAGWQGDPNAWTTHAGAAKVAARLGAGHGVGFLFTPTDPFYFVDIDDCLAEGQWSPGSVQLVQALAGAAVEVSQSGKGLHIIGRSSGVPPHGCKNAALGLELYHEGRFAALTGTGATGDAGRDTTEGLSNVIRAYFPPKVSGPKASAPEWTSGPADEWSGPLDDAELIHLACNTRLTAEQAFGGKATFADLWAANADALHQSYPDNYGDRMYDESSADAALAARLAFWTGCDCDRIESLMRGSALMRDKWDTHPDYVQRTILGAVGLCDSVYAQGAMRVEQRVDQIQPAADPAPAARPELLDAVEMRAGFQLLTPTQQVAHFEGCVYIVDAHRVLAPNGALLKSDQFRAVYGGYVFALDSSNDKTTKSAWEAFTESQAVRYPMADKMTFRPDLPAGAIHSEEGCTFANTYSPANVRRVAGDATPFLVHLGKILPDESDRAIVLAYMAACVQHIGEKFQWCPLIQGVEGNGKTLLSRCVARAVGLRYSHFPSVKDIDSQFNAWMYQRLFVGIEDVFTSDHKNHVMETLKPMITNEMQPIQPKGIDQFNGHVCANFMLNSNHLDGLRKTPNDRRLAVFYCPQQKKSDKARDGMDGDYFPRLYRWLKNEDGYAIVAGYLAEYEIPDALNPATMLQEAPMTTSTAAAIKCGLSTVEQEIEEAIDEGRKGFAGGWVSSIALDKLLADLRKTGAVPPNKRRDMMQALGYDWHPALTNGRVNNRLTIDDGKPRLYVREGHIALNLTAPAAVAAAYVEAQNRTAGPSDAERAFGGG